MAIQMRRGALDKLDRSKLLPGEFAICEDGTVVICYATGKTKVVTSLELENARVSADGTVYETLKERLDQEYNQLTKELEEDISQLSEENVTQAEVDDDGLVSFKNSNGLTVFTLDLSEFSSGGNIYGELVLSAEEISIDEGGAGTFTVKLASTPTANQPVYLAVSDNTKLSVSPSTLTFTPLDWDAEQTVTVTAIMDDDGQDESITVSLTSKKVSPKQLIVSITDTYEVPELVTDGLVLHMDYRGHVDDTSDTIVDLASGVTFKNFDKFTKVEEGIRGDGTFSYLSIVSDDAKTSFLNMLKETGGFTVEIFGTDIPVAFFAPNYRGLVGTGNSNGNDPGIWFQGDVTTSPTRNLQDGTTAYTALGGADWTYTINGSSKRIIYLGDLWPYASDFRHAVFTFSESGEVNVFINGVKCDAPVTDENFASWDFDTMFGGDFSLRNTQLKTGHTISQRIYNRVLTDDEVLMNMKVEAANMGISTF